MENPIKISKWLILRYPDPCYTCSPTLPLEGPWGFLGAAFRVFRSCRFHRSFLVDRDFEMINKWVTLDPHKGPWKPGKTSRKRSSSTCNKQCDSYFASFHLQLMKGKPAIKHRRLRYCDACQRLAICKCKVPNGRAISKGDSGIVMLAKDLQPAKAEAVPMAVTDLGIVMLAKDLQPAKAPVPMAVTDLGIVMLAKDSHPASKA